MREIYVNMLGYPYSPYDGSYRWQAEAPSQEILAAVEALPTDETAFLRTDLDSDPAAQALAALIQPEIFTVLKAFQCQRIRSLRAAAYQAEADGLFFGHEADGDGRDAWVSKRMEIKMRHPWPGTYR